jgi:hypothetical protein
VGTDPLKPKNIITVQQVSGLYHADLIARFETTHSFDKRFGFIVPSKASLYSYDTKKKVAENQITYN